MFTISINTRFNKITNMESLDRKTVTLTWLIRGIEDFFFAFWIGDDLRYFPNYVPFFDALGFEKICKAYLLAGKASEYEGLCEKQAKEKINKIAQDWGHNHRNLTEKIQKFAAREKKFQLVKEIQKLLDMDFDKFTGSQLLVAMERANIECRYPIPNPIHEEFPVEDGIYKDPLDSSGMARFCYVFCRFILDSLKSDFDITIPRSDLDALISVDNNAGERFYKLLFCGKRDEYLCD